MASPTPDTAAAASKRQVFFTRLFSTVILWALIIGAFALRNEVLFALIPAVFGLATCVEFYRLVLGGDDNMAFRRWGILVALLHIAAGVAYAMSKGDALRMGYDIAAMVVVLQGAFLLVYRRPLEGQLTLWRVFATVFGVFYSVICFGYLTRLLHFGGTLNGRWLMLYLIMVTKFTDMGAYAIGTVFGRTKMIPHISPAKSWEGLGGAFLGAFFAAALMLWLVPTELGPLTWISGLACVPLLALVAVSGDLAESVIKRCASIKDSGHSLPGIGGILDLTDSLLFTAPVFYGLLCCLR